MRTQPASLDHPAGIDVSVKKPVGVAHRIGAWILLEWLEILPPTIFFFIGFNFVLLTSNLLVARYLIGSPISCSPQWRHLLSARRYWSPTRSRC